MRPPTAERRTGPVRRIAVQAKLRVGAVHDPLEREADEVADRVLRSPTPAAPQVQRCPGGCPGDDELGPEPLLQRSPAGLAEVAVPLESELGSLRGGGQPLRPAERAFFEPRLGRDLGDVRLHTGARAAELARGLNARAFTMGWDVVFGGGQYLPHAQQGRRLLAHELVHVVQQGAAPAAGAPAVQRQQPGAPAPSVAATLVSSLGGGTVQLRYSTQDPGNAEVLLFNSLSSVFTGTTTITGPAFAKQGTWIRYDVHMPALAHLQQGTAAVLQPAQWTFWLRFGANGWEARADPVTRDIIGGVVAAEKQRTATQESVSTSIAAVLSQHTTGCRARYFYKVMTDNGLSPETIANYGNWCGKGGAGVTMDSMDQCCKEHDECYGAAGCSIFDAACGEKCDACDDKAVACWLAAVARDPQRYGAPGSIRYPCHRCGATLITPADKQRCDQEC
jgi:hypothetical protein